MWVFLSNSQIPEAQVRSQSVLRELGGTVGSGIRTGSHSQRQIRLWSEAIVGDRVSRWLTRIRSQKPEPKVEQNPEQRTKIRECWGLARVRTSKARPRSQEQELLPFSTERDCRLRLAFKGWSRWGLLPVALGDWLSWLPPSAGLGTGGKSGLAAGSTHLWDDLL